MSVSTVPVNIAIGIYGHQMELSEAQGIKKFLVEGIEKEDHVLVDIVTSSKIHEMFSALNLWTQPNSGVQVCLLLSDGFCDLDNGFSYDLNKTFQVEFEGYSELLRQVSFSIIQSSAMHLNAKAGLVGKQIVLQVPYNSLITEKIISDIIFPQLRSSTKPFNLVSIL